VPYLPYPPSLARMHRELRRTSPPCPAVATFSGAAPSIPIALPKEQQIDDNPRAGMTPLEARRRAVIAPGGLERTKGNVATAAGCRRWNR
jgi:hypothetical protein